MWVTEFRLAMDEGRVLDVTRHEHASRPSNRAELADSQSRSPFGGTIKQALSNQNATRTSSRAIPSTKTSSTPTAQLTQISKALVFRRVAPFRDVHLVHPSRESLELRAIDRCEPLRVESALLGDAVPSAEPIDQDVPRPDADDDPRVIGT
jgi:hypothetical protein